MHKLFISYATQRMTFGREEYRNTSRFFLEIPDNLIEKVDRFQPL